MLPFFVAKVGVVVALIAIVSLFICRVAFLLCDILTSVFLSVLLAFFFRVARRLVTYLLIYKAPLNSTSLIGNILLATTVESTPFSLKSLDLTPFSPIVFSVCKHNLLLGLFLLLAVETSC